MQLNGKLAVITGSGRGIGRAMALAFAQKGANVAALDLNPADLDQTVATMHRHRRARASYVCNVANEDAVGATLDKIVTDFGRLDVMVNNAGITKDALLVKVAGRQSRQQDVAATVAEPSSTSISRAYFSAHAKRPPG